MVIEREAEAGARSPWRRAVAGVAHAIDLLPDGVALGLGLVVGVAAVAAAAVGGWVWLAGLGAGLAWGLGAGAGLRPRPAGWARPVVGTAVLLGLAGGMLGLAVVEWEGERGGQDEIVLAEEVDAMRLDLGDGGSTGVGESTGGSDDTGTSSGGEETSSTGEAASSSGGDESMGGVPPPKSPRPRPKVPEPAGDDTTSGGDTRVDVADTDGGEAPSCPSGMVFIEGGSFDGHDVKPFCLDVTEVKVSSYERCMADGKCDEAGIEWGWEGREYEKGESCNRNHEGRGSHPINCVDWKQALGFCAWAGKRLPTEWEWEWAARGREEARTYPWGEEEPTCARAVMREGTNGCGKDRTWHVGSRPKGHSRDGVKDMAGNVWEWTSSKRGDGRIVRGGSWILVLPQFFRASIRNDDIHPTHRNDNVGFRCARTAGGSK